MFRSLPLFALLFLRPNLPPPRPDVDLVTLLGPVTLEYVELTDELLAGTRFGIPAVLLDAPPMDALDVLCSLAMIYLFKPF